MRIGVDLGGTTLVVGLFNGDFELLQQRSIPTDVPGGYACILKDICTLCLEMVAWAKTQPDAMLLFREPLRVGVGVPGVCTADYREVYDCKNLFWPRKPMAADLEAALIRGFEASEALRAGLDPSFWQEVACKVDNDANAAAWAEYQAGALQGAEVGLMVTLGTGVGGGIIIHGRSLRGAHGIGSEIGHMYMGEGAPRCNCGKIGCFETFASAPALVRHYLEQFDGVKPPDAPEEEVEHDGFRLDRDSGSWGDSGGVVVSEPVRISAKRVVDLAKAGDPPAVAAFERYVFYLVQGLQSLILVLDPDVIALGGGLSHAGPFLFDQVQAGLREYAFIKEMTVTPVVPAKLGNNAGLLGAALL